MCVSVRVICECVYVCGNAAHVCVCLRYWWPEFFWLLALWPDAWGQPIHQWPEVRAHAVLDEVRWCSGCLWGALPLVVALSIAFHRIQAISEVYLHFYEQLLSLKWNFRWRLLVLEWILRFWCRFWINLLIQNPVRRPETGRENRHGPATHCRIGCVHGKLLPVLEALQRTHLTG